MAVRTPRYRFGARPGPVRDRPRARPTSSSGVGIFSSVFGLLFFLTFLLFAVQIVYSLYATSVISAAAYDAGRQLARTGDPLIAEARFADTVGSYHASAAFSFEGGTNFGDAETIVVSVTGANPTLLPDRFAEPLPFATVHRTIRIRNEKFVR
jgi:hypothetical protein